MKTIVIERTLGKLIHTVVCLQVCIIKPFLLKRSNLCFFSVCKYSENGAQHGQDLTTCFFWRTRFFFSKNQLRLISRSSVMLMMTTYQLNKTTFLFYKYIYTHFDIHCTSACTDTSIAIANYCAFFWGYAFYCLRMCYSWGPNRAWEQATMGYDKVMRAFL